MKDIFTKGKMIVFSSMTVSVGIGAILLGWVTFFATDYLGLSAAKVGLLFMISKIFDGFTDLVAGYIIDKSHSRLGKVRKTEFARVYMINIHAYVKPSFIIGTTNIRTRHTQYPIWANSYGLPFPSRL